MYYTYGPYTSDIAEGEVTFTQRNRFNDGQQRVSKIVQAHVRGVLLEDTAAAIITSMATLEAAFAIQGQAFTLFLDDGTIHQRMLSAGAIGGVRVIDGPSWPEGRGNEGGTFRTYEVTLEAEYPATGASNLLLAFYESISFSGGGPLDVWRTATTGRPQRQRVIQYTTSQAVQQGAAIGYLSYPTAPGPIWPQFLKGAQRPPDRKSPKRSGPPGAPYYTEFEIAWHYEFEADITLDGVPNRWIG